MMRIGSLFSGIGGLDLGVEAALAEAGIDHRIEWQVEKESFPRLVLARHWPMADRSVVNVRAAVRLAPGFHGPVAHLAAVDLVVAGYPCQPFSQAGLRAGADDPRHLWPYFARVLRDLRPAFALGENVAGHLSLGFDVVLGDLAALGYDARWEVLRASDLGAPHRRERLFWCAVLADPDLRRCEFERHSTSGNDADGCSGSGSMGDRPVGDADQRELEVGQRPMQARRRAVAQRASGRADAWLPQSGVGRGPDGISDRMDLPNRWPAGPRQPQHAWEPSRTLQGTAGRDRALRLRALGNAVVPEQARAAAHRLLLPLLQSQGVA